MAKKENKKDTISKDNFIEFLANRSPGDINKMIEEKGKPHKPISPMFFFPNPNE